MATFVIVHGGWGGGHEWAEVARKLRARGHEVFTPTLTGLGERAHLGSGETSLSDHIQDVLAVLEYEDLHGVLLCGHSYGGMVVSGVADRAPERIRLLIHLDSLVPKDGEALSDLIPADLAGALAGVAQERSDGLAPLPEMLLPAEGVLPEEKRRWYIDRLNPQSSATFTEAVRLSGAIDRLPRAFVRCTGVEVPFLEPFVARAKAEGWLYREIETEHDLQLFDPDGTAELLDELANVRQPASARN
jgi:pimeloyl-ACP methyl ester carboxylesterase